MSKIAWFWLTTFQIYFESTANTWQSRRSLLELKEEQTLRSMFISQIKTCAGGSFQWDVLLSEQVGRRHGREKEKQRHQGGKPTLPRFSGGKSYTLHQAGMKYNGAWCRVFLNYFLAADKRVGLHSCDEGGSYSTGRSLLCHHWCWRWKLRWSSLMAKISKSWAWAVLRKTVLTTLSPAFSLGYRKPT